MDRSPFGFAGAIEARTALDTIGHFVGLMDTDGVMIEANVAALRAGGITRDDVVGRPFWESHWWSHSDVVQQRVRKAIERAAGGETIRFPVKVLGAEAGKRLIMIDFQISPVIGDDGRVHYLVPEGQPFPETATIQGSSSNDAVDDEAAYDSAGQDSAGQDKALSQAMADLVAELADVRGEADALRDLGAGLAAARTVDEVAASIAERAAAAVGAAICSVAVAEPEIDIVTIYHSPQIDRSIADRWRHLPRDEPTPHSEAFRLGTPVVVDTLREIGERYPAILADAERAGLGAIGAYPSARADGGVRATIGFGWSTSNPVVPADVLDPVLALCGAALERAWATDEVGRLAALLDAILREAPVGVAFFDPECRFTMVNPKLAEMNSVAMADHLGRRQHDVVPDIADQIAPALKSVIETGESAHGLEVVGTVATDGGNEHVWQYSYYPVRTPEGESIGAGAIVEEITDQRRALREIARLHEEQRSISQRLQAELLPAFVPDVAGYEIAVSYRAGEDGLEVGGDWYDVIDVSDDDVAIVIGDVVGHDLSAAIVMGQIRNALAGLTHGRKDPAVILERLDEYAGHRPRMLGSTVFYGRLDVTSGRLRYSCAGHHPPLLVALDGSVMSLDRATDAPIGVSSIRGIAEVTIQPGDVLVGYTDGLVEHRSEPLDVGLDRLRRAIGRVVLDERVDALVERLVCDVPHPDRSDDVAVIAIRRNLS